MDAKRCPWCQRWCLKDDACNYIFACGWESGGAFVVGAGCGHSFCFLCGLKLCGPYFAPDGAKAGTAREHHDADCCRRHPEFSEAAFCGGGHNSHCALRWRTQAAPPLGG
jgi:hypothetical protein